MITRFGVWSQTMETKLSLNLSSAISLRVMLGPQFPQLENGANDGVNITYF